MCYNEEQNIAQVLNAIINQKEKEVHIDEIIVVSSGSTDRTDEIVKKIAQKNRRIKLITETKRNGKSKAINIFLREAKNNILVLESADTLPNDTTIEILCSRLKNKKVGIVGARPIPIKTKNKILSFVVKLQWELHHLISEEKPKFGELIAFRKIVKEIPTTAVDEEEIASMIKRKNYELVYEPKAIVFNKGPESIREFLRQRRRIYAGHLKLKKKTNYETATLKSMKILSKLFRTKICQRNILLTTIAVMLEVIGRSLGVIDYLTKKEHDIWKISESTKKL